VFQNVVKDSSASHGRRIQIANIAHEVEDFNWMSNVWEWIWPISKLALVGFCCEQNGLFKYGELHRMSKSRYDELMAQVFAAADIGSNTAHLLIAASDGKLVMRLDNVNEWIPLGEEVAITGVISKERIEQLIAVIREFKRAAASRSAVSIYIFATEAVRVANNFPAVLTMIKSESGIKVDVVSPQREAELSVLGIRLDTFGDPVNLMFEVGGGSVQIASLRAGKIDKEMSLPLGTGRLIATSSLKNPCSPQAIEHSQKYIESELSKCEISVHSPVAVASGGVARGLWRALHPDGEKLLWQAELDYIAWISARLTSSRIVERFNVKAKRAGTLLPGALVYAALLKKFGVNSMKLSEFGVREGAIMEMASGNVKGQKV